MWNRVLGSQKIKRLTAVPSWCGSFTWNRICIKTTPTDLAFFPLVGEILIKMEKKTNKTGVPLVPLTLPGRPRPRALIAQTHRIKSKLDC